MPWFAWLGVVAVLVGVWLFRELVWLPRRSPRSDLGEIPFAKEVIDGHVAAGRALVTESAGWYEVVVDAPQQGVRQEASRTPQEEALAPPEAKAEWSVRWELHVPRNAYMWWFDSFDEVGGLVFRSEPFQYMVHANEARNSMEELLGMARGRAADIDSLISWITGAELDPESRADWPVHEPTLVSAFFRLERKPDQMPN